MKKLNYLLLGLAGLAMASCSNDDLLGPADGDGNVRVMINLPEDMNTRAFGEANFPKILQYAVYNVTDTESEPTLSFTSSVQLADGENSKVININLLPGQEYTLAFFAQASDIYDDSGNGVYNFDAGAKTLTVNYNAMDPASNNVDAYDCFFGAVSTNAISTSNSTFSVDLTRPVAQINWGTNDMGKTTELTNTFGTQGQFTQTTLSTTTENGFYNTLNLLTGDLSSVNAPSTLPAFTVPTNVDYTVPDYSYLALQYILAPTKTSATFDLTLTIKSTANDFTNTINVNNAPVQANFRTNLYGSLLSASSDITVDLQPGFAGGTNHALTWDGTTSTTPQISGTTVSLNQPSDLAGLADIMSGKADLPDGVSSKDFEGYTIVLNNNFDMAGNSLTLGSATRSGNSPVSGSTSFKGTFDGNNQTISNLKISPATTSGNDAIGFIPSLAGSDAALKDVTFENLTIEGGKAEQAGVVGIVSDGASISGVTVKSGSVTAAEGAGGIVGRILAKGSVDQCNNSATITSTSTNAGGIVGAAYYTDASGVAITVSNCNNTGNVSGESQAVGGVVGLSAAKVEQCNNSGKVTGAGAAVGGIVGQQISAGEITGCENTGDVVSTGNVSIYGTGGIVGWIRYSDDGTSSYPYQASITVSGNTNKGAVSGPTGVGGIVGMWYGAGLCESNTSWASSITALGQFAAGIVGGSQWGDTDSYPTALGDSGTLTVTGNTSYTESTNIKGSGCTSTIIYVNNSAKTIVTNNTPENINL